VKKPSLNETSIGKPMNNDTKRPKNPPANVPPQKDSALAQWFRARTENARGTLLIALWRLVREGVVPDGVVLRPVQ
jgi:hypothetical protein